MEEAGSIPLTTSPRMHNGAGGDSALLATHAHASDTFGEQDLQVTSVSLQVHGGGVAPAASSSSSSPPATAAVTSPASPPPVDSDKILRYFHAPHHHALDTSGTHVACASCNPHGQPGSRPTSKLSKFPSNYISTTKYSAWNFLPRNLYEQFQKKANFYCQEAQREGGNSGALHSS